MIFLNNFSVVETILNLFARSTEHLTIVGAMFATKSNGNNMVKADKSLKLIHGQYFKSGLTHSARIVTIFSNHFFVGVVKNKLVIGAHNSLTRVVPVFVSAKKAAIGLFALLKSTTTSVRAKLTLMSSMRKTVATLLTHPAFWVLPKPVGVSSGFVSVPRPKSSNRGYGYTKVLTNFIYCSIFFVVQSFKIILSYFSRFSSFHGLIIAQDTPIYKCSSSFGYAYELKNINQSKWSARTGYSF